MTCSPEFGIVIPTLGDPEKLARTVESVLQCEGPPFEIVVVDQRKDDKILRRLHDIADKRIRHIRRNSPGRNAAMNHGAREARGEYLAFTDDDIVVRSDWLANAQKAFCEDCAPDGVVGKILPYGSAPSSEHLAPQSADWPDRMLLSPAGLLKGFGANTFFSRDAFEAVGGYDPRMGVGGRVGGCGDWELLYRVLVRDYRVLYCPDVAVWHDGWQTREANARKARVYDRARMVGHIKCWREVGGPALRDMTGLCARTLIEGVNHLLHRRRGTAAYYFRKFVYFMSGIPLGLALALADRRARK